MSNVDGHKKIFFYQFEENTKLTCDQNQLPKKFNVYFDIRKKAFDWKVQKIKYSYQKIVLHFEQNG